MSYNCTTSHLLSFIHYTICHMTVTTAQDVIYFTTIHSCVTFLTYFIIIFIVSYFISYNQYDNTYNEFSDLSYLLLWYFWHCHTSSSRESWLMIWRFFTSWCNKTKHWSIFWSILFTWNDKYLMYFWWLGSYMAIWKLLLVVAEDLRALF